MRETSKKTRTEAKNKMTHMASAEANLDNGGGVLVEENVAPAIAQNVTEKCPHGAEVCRAAVHFGQNGQPH